MGDPFYWIGMAILLVGFISYDLWRNRQRSPEERRSPFVLILITVGIMLVGSLVGFVAFADDAEAAVAKPMSVSAQSPSAALVAAAAEGKCDDSCPAAVKKRQDGFEAGDFGRSKGVMLPKKFRKKLNNAAASARPAQRSKLGDWWNDPLGYDWCWAGFVQTAACFKERPDVAEDVTKMVTVCGLTGLLAFVPGEGWLVVGRGASACVLTAWAAKDW